MAKTTSTNKTSSVKSGTTKTSSAKSGSTRRRTASASKKTSRTRKTANGSGGSGTFILFYLIVIGLIIGIGLLLIYTSAIFPKMLYNQIKSDIIEIYQPSGCEDAQPKMPAVFKLDHVPSQNVQNRFV
ncbi:MAG: hypothetical protein J6Y01_03995, partial [Spirochaetales bacterium]|nr:hypothetical protein [Spirochaetales bacterium]